MTMRDDDDAVVTSVMALDTPTRLRWQGTLTAIQVQAWVWRYKTDNRTHHHLGFNLWSDGEKDWR